jgi:hypothetical protein
MTNAKRCPKCGEAPIVTKEEDFLDASAVTWSIFHICKKGFNVDEGPCISEYDAIEAWNHHVEGEGKD